MSMGITEYLIARRLCRYFFLNPDRSDFRQTAHSQTRYILSSHLENFNDLFVSLGESSPPLRTVAPIFGAEPERRMRWPIDHAAKSILEKFSGSNRIAFQQCDLPCN
jgi:hypothetical protein